MEASRSSFPFFRCALPVAGNGEWSLRDNLDTEEAARQRISQKYDMERRLRTSPVPPEHSGRNPCYTGYVEHP